MCARPNGRAPDCQKTLSRGSEGRSPPSEIRIQRHVRWIRKPCAARFRPLKNPWFWKEPRFLRPGCSIIRASLTVALMVSLPRSGSLCHLRWQVPTGHTLSFAPSDARNAHEKCCGIRLWGSAPNPGRGMIPLHPALCQQTGPSGIPPGGPFLRASLPDKNVVY